LPTLEAREELEQEVGNRERGCSTDEAQPGPNSDRNAPGEQQSETGEC
jgi:hypothetical protein